MKNLNNYIKKPVAILLSSEMSDILYVCWVLHNFCNKRCSYCNEINWNGSSGWLEFEKVRAFVDKLIKNNLKTFGKSWH